MKDKINQMFKDKLFLVMLVLGLLTIVAAAGIVTIQRGSGQEQNPYVDMQGQGGYLAQDPEKEAPIAGNSNLTEPKGQDPRVDTQQNLAAGEAMEEAVPGGENQAAEFYEEAQAAGSGLEAATALMLDFGDTSKLAWPVRGNILLDYSMESTIYFPTLDQYKCNPGLVIQGEVSDPVYAPANARVLETGSNEEIGNYLTLDLGNEYTLICGQLKEVSAAPGEYLEKGRLMGYVAEPTKYYTVEGSNIFLEMQYQGKTVDPLDYLE